MASNFTNRWTKIFITIKGVTFCDADSTTEFELEITPLFVFECHFLVKLSLYAHTYVMPFDFFLVN